MKKRSSIPQYTYRQSVKHEERVVYRRISLVLLATAILLAIVYFWGLSFINLLGVISQGTADTDTTQSGFERPLLKPSLDPLQTPTNVGKVNISGNTTPEVAVALLVNGQPVSETTSDTGGSFSFSAVVIKDGINQITVTATDKDGDKESFSTSIVLDKTPPSLVVTKPAEGASFGSTTKTVLVSGTTSDPEGVVYVNSIQVTLDPKTGNFSYNLPIKSGQTPIEIKAFDAAGNSVAQKRTITAEASSTPSPEGN